MKKIYLILSILIITNSACVTNAITGRSQLSLVSDTELQTMSFTQYKQFLATNKVISAGNSNADMVKRVGNRVAAAVKQYYTKKGLPNELDNYNWEFNLVESKEVNAWCMPGGKVVVYTGLLPITQNEAALAVVLGHEITHAVAHHGNERMSQVAIAQGLEIAGNIFTSNNQKANTIFTNIFAPTAQVAVLLPNSRNQEYEADHFGLNFAAMAGYNPREAIPFWQRMSAAAGTGKPPEFLATHPSDENRIAKLQGYMNEALSYYKPVGPNR